MNFLPPGSGLRNGAALPALVLVALALASGAPLVRAQELAADAGWRDVSLAEYRQHLQELDALVAACQKQRAALGAGQGAAMPQGAAKLDFPGCDPARIGPDDRVQLPAGANSQTREVRYDWLRAVLGRAARKDGATRTHHPREQFPLPRMLP